MELIQIINFLGLFLNLIGTIILAISLSGYLTALHASIATHDMTIKGLVNKNNKVLVADGIGYLLTKGVKNSAYRIKIGLFCIAFGFLIQLIPLFCNIPNASN